VHVNSHQGMNIDLSERFPHLARAPIVEAVIHWRARSESMQNQEQIKTALQSKLSDYPELLTLRTLMLTTEVGPECASQAQSAKWHGFRLTSRDGRNIAQFTRDGFVFSRISPYENWERFSSEAQRLWRVYVELAEPSEVERLGVRFINRITPVALDRLDDILINPPRSPEPLPLLIEEFLYRSLYNVPGQPYRVSVTQTTQPPNPPESDSIGLIVDIDVFADATMEPNSDSMERRLQEMRWLKNKVFFSLFIDRALEQFKERK